MKILIIGFLAIVILVAIVIGIGYSLPIKHRASRMATYTTSPEKVFAIISAQHAFPEWRSKVESVENVLRPDGKASYREIGGDGTILYVVDESIPDNRLVTRIDDDKLPFGGRWTFELTASSNGTTLRITEDGEVYNPLFRFMSKYVFGHHATLDTYLTDLGKKLGATVSPQS